MQFLPETVELYMSWGTTDTLEHITMTTRPTLRFTLTPYTCRFPSGTFTLEELADIYRLQTGFRIYGLDLWHHLRVAKGLRATYTMHFVLNTAPMGELPLIGQPLPSVVASRVAAIEAKAKPKNEVVTPVKKRVKKHGYNTRSKLNSLLGVYESDSEDDAPAAPVKARRRADSEDSEWDEDSDGRPLRMPKRSEAESSDSGEDSEVDEGIKRTYPSKTERLLFFPDGLELYVQDVGSPKWEGIRLDIQTIPPFRWGPKAGQDRGKQVRFQTPKHPDGLHEHHLVAHYRKHITKEHVSSSSNGLQCIFVASGRHKDRSLASLLLNETKKELELAGSSLQPVQLDVSKVMARLEESSLEESSKTLNRALTFEFSCSQDELPAPIPADVEDEEMYKDMPPLISVAEVTLERLEAKAAALESERQTLDRIEGKLADIRALEQEVGPRRRLWCAEEFGQDVKESNLDKVEADYKAELIEIERLEARLATVRALGYEVATRREALLKAAELM
jgi:hypothetical protein